MAESVDQLMAAGTSFMREGQHAKAVDALIQAVRLSPQNAEIWNVLGSALRSAGRVPDAEAAHKQAIALKPDFADAWNHLAVALGIQGKNDEAIAVATRALELRPDLMPARRNLAKILGNAHRYAAAVEQVRLVVAAQPDDADSFNNMGNALHAIGRVDEAIASYRTALSLRPDDPGARSNLLFALQFDPLTNAGLIQQEHAQWWERIEQPLVAQRKPHANVREPARKLRIGYVSPDFREHAAAFFIEPLLANHDHANFDIVCYSDAVRTDGVTTRLRRTADVWTDSHAFTDEQLADRVIADRIDLLVDLSVHTRGNRLRTFAMKPAPVQLSYLGYCGTSGVGAMDFRLTDAIVDPPGTSEAWSTEHLLRLPRTFCCYAAPSNAPPVALLPATKNKHITFGAFNSLPKSVPVMVELWSRILRELPTAKLMLLRDGVGDEIVRADLLARFASHGIGPERLILKAGVGMREYLTLVSSVDISLDTFPFNGHTTTCHALYMGVPTVTLAGERPVSRVGASLLRFVGLERLVATTPEAYVSTAIELAANAGRLYDIRKSLRQKMEHSPLMDGKSFARDVEHAFRDAWKRWCES